MAFIDFCETAMPVLRQRSPEPALLPASLLPSLSPSYPAAPNVVTIVEDDTVAFSAEEWRVLALAHDDGLETLRAPRKRSRLGKLVFGPTPPSRMLANERLEALRRLAVEARHKGWLVPVDAIRAARKAGFTTAQIGRVVDSIRRVRAPLRRTFA